MLPLNSYLVKMNIKLHNILAEIVNTYEVLQEGIFITAVLALIKWYYTITFSSADDRDNIYA